MEDCITLDDIAVGQQIIIGNQRFMVAEGQHELGEMTVNGEPATALVLHLFLLAVDLQQ